VIALMDRVGKPFDLKDSIAIAIEKREVIIRSLQQMKGNVFLVHVWATWPESSTKEMPRIQGLYDKYHARGFEVISISVDETPAKAEAFWAKTPLPWHHYWDKSLKDALGDYWRRPVLWLVDKQGIVRDVNARNNVEQKIERLLAEP
jgi:peroxiredoxin